MCYFCSINGKQHNESITTTQNTLTFKIGFRAFHWSVPFHPFRSGCFIQVPVCDPVLCSTWVQVASHGDMNLTWDLKSLRSHVDLADYNSGLRSTWQICPGCTKRPELLFLVGKLQLCFFYSYGLSHSNFSLQVRDSRMTHASADV